MVGSKTIKNFVRFLDEIRFYPYAKNFKVSEVCSFWDELSEEEQQTLLRQFVAYCRKTHFFNFVFDDDSISDLDLVYSPVFDRDYAFDFESLLLLLYDEEKGSEFIIPSVFRKHDEYFKFDESFEQYLNDAITKGHISFLEIVGKAFSFTVYKRL